MYAMYNFSLQQLIIATPKKTSLTVLIPFNGINCTLTLHLVCEINNNDNNQLLNCFAYERVTFRSISMSTTSFKSLEHFRFIKKRHIYVGHKYIRLSRESKKWWPIVLPSCLDASRFPLSAVMVANQIYLGYTLCRVDV